MGGIGWHNGLPFRVGGGETDEELVYVALRRSLGEKGPGPVDGLEDRWRQCKAIAIATSAAADERAVLQAFPGYATDHLVRWEGELGVDYGGATDTERREAVADAVVAELLADVPSLEAGLQAIDARAHVALLAFAAATIVYFGKQFASRLAGAPPFGGMQAAGWPNFASDFVLFVHWTLGPGETTVPELARQEIADYLNRVLPAHVDWQIHTSTGFLLDGGPDGTSRLDQTAFDD